MRIKKVSQTTPVTAQVVDGYSTSTTDAYSANYVNERLDTITLNGSTLTPETGYNLSGLVVVKKAGIVFFTGTVQIPAISTIDNSVVAFTLPTGWRPTITGNFAIMAYTGSDPTPMARVRIGIDGTVKISKISDNLMANTNIQMAAISYVAAE